MKISIIGAGSWGTALAKLLASAGHETLIWAYEKEVVESIQSDHTNAIYLSGVQLPATLRATHDLEEAVRGREMIVDVVPSHLVRSVIGGVADQIDGNPIFVVATKGIENQTQATMDEVLADVLPSRVHQRLCALSGPSFAKEVAAEAPTAVVAASTDPRVAEATQQAFSTRRFRVYTSDDIVGVELGGALKNVIAIAAGASDGLGFGHNSRAGLITRGLAEISRLAVKKGAHPLTLAGLAGMGDLVLTCTGDLSRNRTVGFALGQGKTLEDILSGMRMVAEGVKTAKAARNLARKIGVEMPITEMVYRVLYEGMSARDAVDELMTRDLRPERE